MKLLVSLLLLVACNAGMRCPDTDQKFFCPAGYVYTKNQQCVGEVCEQSDYAIPGVLGEGCYCQKRETCASFASTKGNDNSQLCGRGGHLLNLNGTLCGCVGQSVDSGRCNYWKQSTPACEINTDFRLGDSPCCMEAPKQACSESTLTCGSGLIPDTTEGNMCATSACQATTDFKDADSVCCKAAPQKCDAGYLADVRQCPVGFTHNPFNDCASNVCGSLDFEDENAACKCTKQATCAEGRAANMTCPSLDGAADNMADNVLCADAICGAADFLDSKAGCCTEGPPQTCGQANGIIARAGQGSGLELLCKASNFYFLNATQTCEKSLCRWSEFNVAKYPNPPPCCMKCLPPFVGNAANDGCELKCKAPKVPNAANDECDLNCKAPKVKNAAKDGCELKCEAPKVLNAAKDACELKCEAPKVPNAAKDACELKCEAPKVPNAAYDACETPMKNCASFTGTCPADTTQLKDEHNGCWVENGVDDACTADHCCVKMCSSFTGTCPADTKKNDDKRCTRMGGGGATCDAAICCEYNCKTSFVGTCKRGKEVVDKSYGLEEWNKSSLSSILHCGKYKPSCIPDVDYWKWNGDNNGNAYSGNVLNDANGDTVDKKMSCCQKTCKSAEGPPYGGKCTAKGGKEMMLKESGGDIYCTEGGGDEKVPVGMSYKPPDKCSEESFNDHCCEEKTCEMEKCKLAGKAAGHEAPGGGDPFDAYCGKELQIDGQNPCKTKCELGSTSTKADVMACAVCSNKNNPKAKWCHPCLQCKAKHYLNITLDDLTKPEDKKTDKKTDDSAKVKQSKPKLPTFAPTPKPTNPKKPAFEKAKHAEAKKKFKVVTKIADKTRPPTNAPTKGPTNKGYKIVKRKQKRKAAKATLGFPLTAAEANNPVMQEALTTGVANSLGKDPADVKITSIDGVPTTRRRLLADVQIEFEVVSNSDDADAADQLKTDLETAATEGSIVANVQEAANEKGVLVQALQDMELVMAKPTVKVAEVEVDVEVQEREEEQDSPQFSSGSTSAVSALAAATSAVAVMLGTCM